MWSCLGTTSALVGPPRGKNSVFIPNQQLSDSHPKRKLRQPPPLPSHRSKSFHDFPVGCSILFPNRDIVARRNRPKVFNLSVEREGKIICVIGLCVRKMPLGKKVTAMYQTLAKGIFALFHLEPRCLSHGARLNAARTEYEGFQKRATGHR